MGGLACATPLLTSSARPERTRPVKEVPQKDILERDCPLEEQAHFKALELYIATALHAWEPFSTLQEAVAHDIVRAVLDPGEEPLFAGDDLKVQTAVLLASVETHEGHGMRYVDSGFCNDPKQKDNPLLKNGGCDGGHAVSLFQIHPGPGIVLLDNGLYGYRRSPPPVDPSRTSQIVDAKALLDRPTATKTALHMLRAALKHDGTLCEYSGELRPCPKAAKRLTFAKEWLTSHPFM